MRDFWADLRRVRELLVEMKALQERVEKFAEEAHLDAGLARPLYEAAQSFDSVVRDLALEVNIVENGPSD